MGRSKFTISVMENKLSEEKKFPRRYVVNTWETASGALKSSATPPPGVEARRQIRPAGGG